MLLIWNLSEGNVAMGACVFATCHASTGVMGVICETCVLGTPGFYVGVVDI